jgi:TRAP-type C4-dicarboxylate transport system permease small subunit
MKKLIDKILEIIMIAMVITITIAVVWQVMSRYIFNAPSSFTEELAKFLLIWITFLGAIYTSNKKLNIAIDLLPGRLKPPFSNYLKIIIHSFVILFSLVVMVTGGSNLVYLNWILGQQTAALQIPIALVYLILPVSGVLIIFYETAYIYKETQQLKPKNTWKSPV